MADLASEGFNKRSRFAECVVKNTKGEVGGGRGNNLMSKLASGSRIREAFLVTETEQHGGGVIRLDGKKFICVIAMFTR